MKSLLLKSVCLFLFTGLLFSCSEEDDDSLFLDYDVTCAYVLNYGSSSGGSISRFDYTDSVVTNNYYKAVNGSELTGNLEYSYNYNNQTFVIENNPDKIITLNDTLAQLKNGVSLEYPRCCVGDGDYLYISCWGSSPDYKYMNNSYVIKYNINSYTVEDTLFISGGPEGVEIANNKLYVALNYKDSIAVVDFDDNNSISYIETPAVTSYFLKDSDDNLYVSLVSTYSNSSSNTGIGFINTSNDELTRYSLSNVSSSYSQIMCMNGDKSKIYVIASSYDSFWNLVGGVYVFNTDSKSFDENALISGISGINGVVVNPENEDIYVLTVPSYTDAGFLNLYGSDGLSKSSYSVGVAPGRVFFLD